MSVVLAEVRINGDRMGVVGLLVIILLLVLRFCFYVTFHRSRNNSAGAALWLVDWEERGTGFSMLVTHYYKWFGVLFFMDPIQGGCFRVGRSI